MTPESLSRRRRIVYCGHGRAGYLGLERLLTAEVCAPDGLLVLSNCRPESLPLVDAARASGIDVLTDSVQAPEVIGRATQFQADLLLSVHYREKVPSEVLDATRLGGLNLHPSLLPRHRGTFAVPWTIIEGDTHAGISYHVMTSEFDAGSIVLQRETPVAPDETAIELFNRLVQLGIDLLVPALARFCGSSRVFQPQEGQAAYHPRVLPYGGRIDPAWGIERVERFIRAMTFPPHQAATLQFNGVALEIRSLDDFKRAMSSACES